MPQTALAVIAMFVAASSYCLAQHTAPLVTDVHEHTHNEPHPKVLDEDRFHTSRDGATIYLPEENDAFTFVVFGDRTGGPHEGINVLAQAVADANLLEPDLVMTVGDLINGYNQTDGWMEQMRQYKEVMDSLLCPWFPVAGNHDIYWRGPNRPEGEHEASYEMHFGPLWYAFEHKNSWFIVLYSDEGNPETGEKDFNKPEAQRMSPEQFGWLEGTLSEVTHEAEHVFVFLHHPRWLGRYGDDWDRVHELLVEAGNVSAVFAGHIHRMRYDPRDGIEYVALATVGGGQSGLSPAAGYLHHFNIVTVRQDQLALSSVPVGEIMDVRAITGEVSTAAERLARMEPVLGPTPEMSADGAVSGELSVTLANPVDFEIEIELTPASPDTRWTVTPDHTHARIAPNATRRFTFRLDRPGDQLDGYVRPVSVTLGADLLTEHARFPVRKTSVAVPGTLVLPEPATPDAEGVLALDGESGGAWVSRDAVALEPGPFTIEAWVRPESLTGRDAIVDQGEFGLRLEDGRPIFTARLGNRWTDAAMDEGSRLRTGVWCHLAGVYDGSEVRLYLDGELLDSAPANGSVRTPGQPLAIGADTWNDALHNTFHGQIDEVRLTSGARYAGERFAPERRLAPDADTRLLLHMDAGIGPYLFDGSGRRAHPEVVEPATVIEGR
ncbi:MAG: LamG-like jellyroll fold domain-containing protein [Phycisphaerales bacterium JB040]